MSASGPSGPLVYYFGVYHIAEKFLFFLQLVEVIWKIAANAGETFTQSCADKYEGFFCTLPHEIWLSLTIVMNHFSYL